MKSIYLDHAATTPVHPDVVEAMVPVYQETFGNPSSVHQFGRKARSILDKARRKAASSLNAHEKEIVFTSGGTEADNLAVIGTAVQIKIREVISLPLRLNIMLHYMQSNT